MNKSDPEALSNWILIMSFIMFVLGVYWFFRFWKKK